VSSNRAREPHFRPGSVHTRGGPAPDSAGWRHIVEAPATLALDTRLDALRVALNRRRAADRSLPFGGASRASRTAARSPCAPGGRCTSKLRYIDSSPRIGGVIVSAGNDAYHRGMDELLVYTSQISPTASGLPRVPATASKECELKPREGRPLRVPVSALREPFATTLFHYRASLGLLHRERHLGSGRAGPAAVRG